MKKVLLLSGVIVLSMTALAQTKQGALKNTRQVTFDDARYENPRWSPDGNLIAFTNEGYDNLYVQDLTSGAKTRLTDMSGVGYGYQWSADGQEILVRDTRWEQVGDGIQRLHAIHALSLDGQSVRMTDDAEYMQPAAWRYTAAGAKKIVAPDARVRSTSLKALPARKAQSLAALPQSNISFIADGEALWVVDAAGAKKKIYNDAAYCPVLSPDGTRVAFNAVDDVCVINIDGTGLRRMATGFNPSWVGNTQLVYERTTDDGHRYTAGDLYIINVSNGAEKALTTSRNVIEMQPVVSPDGSRVAFVSHTDGQVYIAELY